MDVDTRFDVSVRAQRLVLSRLQAEYFGWTRAAIRHRLKNGAWQELFPRVYQAGDFPTSFEQLCVAASLWSSGFVSHETAGYLHRLDGFDRRSSQIVDVSVPRFSTNGRAPGLRLHRTQELDWRDLTHCNDISTTSLVRTLIDVAPRASWRNLLLAYEDVVRRGHWRALLERFDELRPGRKGLAMLALLIHRRGPDPTPTESAGEAICDHALLSNGLRAVRQLRVSYRGRSARLDLAFPEVGVAIECDSAKWHAPRYEEDRERDGWLGFHGWHTERFTWKALQNEWQVVQRVKAQLEQRKHMAAPLISRG